MSETYRIRDAAAIVVLISFVMGSLIIAFSLLGVAIDVIWFLAFQQFLILLVCFLVRKKRNLPSPWESIAWQKHLQAIFYGILFILAFGWLIGLVLQPQQTELVVLDPLDSWLLALIVIFLAPLAEERYFRGVFQVALARRFGVGIGILGSGVLFGLIHLGSSNLAAVGYLMGVGMLLGVVRQKAGLWAAVSVHSLHNGIGLLGSASGDAQVTALICIGSLLIFLGAAMKFQANSTSA
jgi:membrane protease YdiL (CAAX protease family)